MFKKFKIYSVRGTIWTEDGEIHCKIGKCTDEFQWLFGTMEICSRNGLFEALRIIHSASQEATMNNLEISFQSSLK